MNKREAAIIAAYTGTLLGDFGTMHEYIEKILERPVFTHELAFEEVCKEIKEAAYDDFMEIHKGLIN